MSLLLHCTAQVLYSNPKPSPAPTLRAPVCAAALPQVLSSNQTLRRLDLSRQIKLGPTGLAAIAKSLMTVENSALQELILAEVAADAKVRSSNGNRISRSRSRSGAVVVRALHERVGRPL